MDFEEKKMNEVIAPDAPPYMGSTKYEISEIPDYLIYEVLDGIPVYYNGWKQVMDKTKTFEEIMGYGDYQTILLTYIKDYLQEMLGKQWLILQGETGLHVNHKSNPSLDLCVFARKDLSLKKAKHKYLNIPPKVVIEVDTKADVAFFENNKGNNYYISKTKKLLDFGVEAVIWIFTQDEKVMAAFPQESWLTMDWKDEISIMGLTFSIQKVIDASETA